MRNSLFFILITAGIFFTKLSFSNNALILSKINATVKDTANKPFTIGAGFTGAFLTIRGGYALIPHLEMRYKLFRILSGPSITPNYSISPSYSGPDHGLIMSGYAVQCDIFVTKKKNPLLIHSIVLINSYDDKSEYVPGVTCIASMRAFSVGIGLGKQYTFNDQLSFFGSLSFMYGICHDTYNFDPPYPHGTTRVNPDYYFGQAVAGFSYKIR